MSHIVEIKTEVRDTEAIGLACRRLELTVPTHGTARVFTAEVTGVMVSLPDWRYPVVIDTESGQLQYDNYGGRWGEQRHLHRFLQTYAVEKVKLEARRKGHTVSEFNLADGSVRLTVAVGGVA